jgi:hypothetical protein
MMTLLESRDSVFIERTAVAYHLHLLVIVFKKAYDSVRREALFSFSLSLEYPGK